jgi:formylglycine-generating enzyme required for sulfatase activity/curved DNA-binding protein CbpA
MHSTRDFYTILGVPRRASDIEIRRAFRALAKEHHPDSRQVESDAPEHDFRLITEAYETLKDPARRAAYDEELNQERQLSAPSSKSGKPPFAFAAGLAVGVAIALFAVGAFFFFGRGKSGDKAQDSLTSAAVLREAGKPAAEVSPGTAAAVAKAEAPSKAGSSFAKTESEASPKTGAGIANPDATLAEDAKPDTAPSPEERAPDRISSAPARLAEPRAAFPMPERRGTDRGRPLGPGESLAFAVGKSDGEQVLRLTPGKGLTESFADCPNCPQMVVIPSGHTIMGSRPESDGFRSEEAPPHRIALSRPLAISKSAVSAQNWRACVDAGVCRLTLSSLLAVGPRVAATRVSWFDAKAYVEWLSQTTGWRYRLLTEAEWEYAARAGQRTEQSGRERYALDSGAFPRVRFDHVAGLGPNSWGIQSGNVLEWVEDCWHSSYDLAPADASPWLSTSGGDCAYRVVRGNAKASGAFGWRPSARAREFADASAPTLGFRVAREIVPYEER